MAEEAQASNAPDQAASQPTLTLTPQSQSQSHYTHLLVGTSLALSVLSAALAQVPSNRILHVDTQDYYGSHNASLTLSQLLSFVQRSKGGRVAFPYFDQGSQDGSAGSADTAGTCLPDPLRKLDRHYSISISPALQPATSPSLDVLIRSQVAKYATFRLLQRTALWDAAARALRTVPSSKEDVFKTSELTLIEKRKLMKFLQFVADPAAPYTDNEVLYKPNAARPFGVFLTEAFKLPPHLVQAVMYGIALCPSEDEPTEAALKRLQTHLRSVGRYGNAAYLVPQYGGAGEIAQGYCRAAAVQGATFILGKHIQELTVQEAQGGAAPATPTASLVLADIDETFTADVVIGEDDLLPSDLGTAHTRGHRTDALLLQGILVLDRGVRFAQRKAGDDDDDADPPPDQDEPVETGLIVFPPGSLPLAAAAAAAADSSSSSSPSSTLPNRTNPSTITALVLGEGTFCCPKGQYVVHISAEVRPPAAASASTVPEADAALLALALAEETFRAARERVLDLARDSSVEWRSEAGAEAAQQSGARGDTAAHAQPVPLAEAFWVEERSVHSSEGAGAAAQHSIVTRVPREYESVPLPAPLGPDSSTTTTCEPSSASATLTTLLDRSTRAAEHLFYAHAHAHAQPSTSGSVSDPQRYPTTQEYLAWREERVRVRTRTRGGRRYKHRYRHPDEFKGRGGVGPEGLSDSEGEEGEEAGEGEGGGEGEGEGGAAAAAEGEDDGEDMIFFFPPPLDDGPGPGDGE